MINKTQRPYLMHLIFDCETSGFSESRLLQLGCQLIDDDWHITMECSLLVRPDGWTIEEGATKVHGITQAYATEHGLPVQVVIGIFCGLASKSKLLVGHNLDFDMRIVEGEIERAKWPRMQRPQFCTMAKMTPVCRLPPSDKMLKQGRKDFKRPKLMEAHQHAFGEGFEGAHDAMADCRATARLFRWLIEGGKPTVREDSFGQPTVVSSFHVPPPIPNHVLPVDFAPPAPLPQ